MYDLHSLHGQFSGCHFLISSLKASNNVSFLNSLATISQIFVPRNEILLFQKKYFLQSNHVVKTVANCNHYSLVEIIVSHQGETYFYRPSLNISVAGTCKFVMCIRTVSSVSNISLKDDFLLLKTIRKYLSYSLFILLLTVLV